MDLHDRFNKTDELLKNFKNGQDLYNKSALFNSAIQMMVDGMTVYEALEVMVSVAEKGQKAFEDYVVKNNNIGVIIMADEKLNKDL